MADWTGRPTGEDDALCAPLNTQTRSHTLPSVISTPNGDIDNNTQERPTSPPSPLRCTHGRMRSTLCTAVSRCTCSFRRGSTWSVWPRGGRLPKPRPRSMRRRVATLVGVPVPVEGGPKASSWGWYAHPDGP